MNSSKNNLNKVEILKNVVSATNNKLSLSTTKVDSDKALTSSNKNVPSTYKISKVFTTGMNSMQHVMLWNTYLNMKRGFLCIYLLNFLRYYLNTNFTFSWHKNQN